MAKIYEWSNKGQKGEVVADNMKAAKREVAKKFGNAIKIPKGTVIKKIGLTKVSKVVPLPATQSVAIAATRSTELSNEYTLTKTSSFTNVSFQLNGSPISVGPDAEYIAPKGSVISNVIELK